MGADSIRVVHPLFQAEGGGSIPTSALRLHVARAPLQDVIALNRLWHSRLPRLNKSNLLRTVNLVSYGISHDGVYYAVAVWTNPVARNLPQQTWLELRRLAIAPDAPRNTASRTLAVMTRLVHKDMPEIVRLVSYQDTDVHTGGIYRAAGWTPTSINKDGGWDRPSRFRVPAQSMSPKQRWEKVLHAD